MPSATIPRAITPQQAADALKEQLGSGYKVTPHGTSSLTVSTAAWPSPRCEWPGTGMPPPSASTAAG